MSKLRIHPVYPLCLTLLLLAAAEFWVHRYAYFSDGNRRIDHWTGRVSCLNERDEWGSCSP